MKPITKVIIGLAGMASVGLLTYYVVTREKEPEVVEKPITNPEKDTVATAQVVQDTILGSLVKALNIDGEEFTLTDEDGVYTNITNDKILIIKENIWKRIIRKARNKFPHKAEDCDEKYLMPDLSEFQFVGLLTYFAESASSKATTAYAAIEIRNGKAKSFAGGNICCHCGGEPLVRQQVDAVIEQ